MVVAEPILTIIDDALTNDLSNDKMDSWNIEDADAIEASGNIPNDPE